MVLTLLCNANVWKVVQLLPCIHGSAAHEGSLVPHIIYLNRGTSMVTTDYVASVVAMSISVCKQ